MKILFISDLDGTLLRNDAHPSDFTVDTLNALMQEGCHFSIATARTEHSSQSICERIRINSPMVLMNGVCVFDGVSKQYLRVHTIPTESVAQILDVFKQNGQSGFMHQIKDGVLTSYYETISTPEQSEFVQSRVKRYGHIYTHTESYRQIGGDSIVFFSLLNSWERLEPVYNDLKHVAGINVIFYRNTYAENSWFLEITSEHASKRSAAQFVKQHCGFDKVIAFGDNLNDIPLFEGADEAYAVENAHDDLKKIATGIIGTNESDAVARKIYQIYKGVEI